ncbi:MAG: molybdopterin molybdotransferase MoeA [Hyphomicrobiales bacterium]|nr:molybdopterin molybdotransferase MoeA [Hyphomicrobiales bacterium]
MSLLSVDEALSRILDGVSPTGTETIPIQSALRRTLAEPVLSQRTQPPFDTSAMDGYAVRAEDVTILPKALKLVGRSVAGKRFEGVIGSAEATRIFTGAPLPEGADTIIIQENTRETGGTVEVLEGSTDRGQFVRRRGLDFGAGQQLLSEGTILLPRHIAVAAAGNNGSIVVRRKPRVAILSTGDELVPPGHAPGIDQIVASNGVAIAALVNAAGGEAVDIGIVRDTTEALHSALDRVFEEEPDVLITSGGASVGEHDLVQGVMTERGLELGFWRIAMRPGKPLMFGRLDHMRFIGLPGNPVSSLVCSRLFLWPLLKALLGHEPERQMEEARLAAPLPANDRRQDYMRGVFTDCGHTVTPFDKQDSSMLSTLAKADCLIIRPPHAPPAAAGESVPVLRLDF